MDDSFFSVATRQRAHRAFTDEPVDDATVERLLDAAVRAPSAENRQPWEFVVVRDAATRAALGELMRRAWDTGGKQWSAARLSTGVLADVERGMHGGVAGAPVIVVACADLERGAPQTVAASMFPAVQNLLLAATAVGLGSALTTIATVFAGEVRSLLALAERVEPVALVPVGWPQRRLGPSRREPARAHMHRERYGTPW